MSSQGKVLHKQQFQNAQQVIEVTIKAKPKVKFGLKTKQKYSPKPFVRDCFLKKELEKYARETDMKRSKIKADKMNPVRLMPKLKIHQPNTVIEIHKKSRNERKEDNKLPPGITWNEVLKDVNSESTISQSSNINPMNNIASNDKSEDKRLQFGANEINQEKPMSKSETAQPNTATETHKKRKEKKRHDVLASDVTWGEYLTNVSDSNSNNSQIANDRSVENIVEKGSPNKKYRVKNKIPAKDKEISKKHKSAEFKEKQNKNEYSGQENINKLNAENINKHLNRQEMPMVLPTTLYKPLLINKSMQTSMISRDENSSPDQPDYQKSLPKSTKTQSEQTHTPLGESALRLLRQLRDRLSSKGGSDGSEIVNLLEAYFGSAEGKSNKGELDVGDSASPIFPPGFIQTESHVSTADTEKQKLKRIIMEQDKKLQEQEKAIHELKSLSQKLLTYHEKLKEQATQIANNNPHNNSVNSCSNKSAKGGDSGIDTSASEDAQKRLIIERDSVVQENRNLRQIILNLEIKLNNYETENVERLEKLKYGLPGNCQERHVTSRIKNLKESRAMETIPKSSTNSEADSAYEDKSYKSSRPTSKASSNINRGSVPNQENKISALKDVSQNDKSLLDQMDLSFRSVLSEVGHYFNNVSNCDPYERCPRIEVARSYPAELNSYPIATLSDLSSNLSTESTRREKSLPKIFSKDKGKLFSETPIYSTTDNYFESTHVNDRKSNSSDFKTTVSKSKFAPQLSYIDSVLSDDESTTLEPVVMNKSNSL